MRWSAACELKEQVRYASLCARRRWAVAQGTRLNPLHTGKVRCFSTIGSPVLKVRIDSPTELRVCLNHGLITDSPLAKSAPGGGGIACDQCIGQCNIHGMRLALCVWPVGGAAGWRQWVLWRTTCSVRRYDSLSRQ